MVEIVNMTTRLKEGEKNKNKTRMTILRPRPSGEINASYVIGQLARRQGVRLREGWVHVLLSVMESVKT